MSPTSDWLRRIWGAQVSQELRAFERRLGYAFRDRDLLRLALTHRSFANEKGLGDQNERLEFLGDAVLDLVAASMLFDAHPGFPEGELSRRKSGLVSEPSLASLAEEVGLGELLRLGVGEERSGGRRKPSLLSDALEAVFGAVYLDGGLVAARSVIEPLLQRGMESIDDWDRRDPKTRLQELLQSQGISVPRYRLIAERGPDHAKTFTVECRIDGRIAGVGRGASKKAAEQEAAREALAAPDLLGPTTS
jgi:ribonuclease-3